MDSKGIKRHYTKLGIKTFLFYNVIIAAVWFAFLYVHQDDFSQFDIEKLQAMIQERASRLVVVNYSNLSQRKHINLICNNLHAIYGA